MSGRKCADGGKAKPAFFGGKGKTAPARKKTPAMPMCADGGKAKKRKGC